MFLQMHIACPQNHLNENREALGLDPEAAIQKLKSRTQFVREHLHEISQTSSAII